VDHKKFLQICELLHTGLTNQVMDRTYNSVGSNIFFEFGKQKEIIFPNGKIRLQKEWCIWLSGTSWRISQHNKYVIGSGESHEIKIQPYLEKLLGKRLLSFSFSSQFLDIEINFEDGFQVTTFFNQIEENQWLIFLPNKTELIIDCSSAIAIESVQHLSKQIEIESRYKKIDRSFLNAEVEKVLFKENEISKLICSNGISIDLGSSAWRLEKSNQYCIGRKDYYFGSTGEQVKEHKDKLLGLIGKKIKHMSLDSSGMDGRIGFEDNYILEIFTHSKTDSWKICQNENVVLGANIKI